MNRTVKLIVIAAVVEMSLVGLAALVWKDRMMGGLDLTHLPRPFPQALFLPLWLAVCALYLARRATSDRPRISDSHRRYIMTGLTIVSIVFVALHAFTTYSFLTGWTPDRQAFLRTWTVITGVWIAIQGNNTAKLDPPSGDGAPRPAIWTRMAMRMGWFMALSGVLLVVCGLAAPQVMILPVLVVLTVASVAGEIAYRRMTRPGQPA